MRQLVIHLGDRKTGSTSIQAALRQKTWKGGETLDYPVFGLHHGFFASGLIKQTNTKRVVKRLQKVLNKSEAEISVVSSEHFEDVDPSFLKEVLDGQFPDYKGNVRLIAYVRPHIDRVVSSWAERTKLGIYDGTLENFLNLSMRNGRFRYSPRFLSWKKVFGDSFELRPMIRANLYKHCVVHDFLNFAMQTDDFELLEEPQANVSLTIEDLAILKEYHRILGEVPTGRLNEKSTVPLGRNLGIFLSEQQGTRRTKVQIHKSIVPKTRKAFEADAAALDSAFFDGTPMSDALASTVEKAVSEPQSIDAKDHFQPEELRLIRVWARYAACMSQIAPDEWSSHFSRFRLMEEGSLAD